MILRMQTTEVMGVYETYAGRMNRLRRESSREGQLQSSRRVKLEMAQKVRGKSLWYDQSQEKIIF